MTVLLVPSVTCANPVVESVPLKIARGPVGSRKHVLPAFMPGRPGERKISGICSISWTVVRTVPRLVLPELLVECLLFEERQHADAPA